MLTTAASIARFCGEIIVPSTPPEVLAASADNASDPQPDCQPAGTLALPL